MEPRFQRAEGSSSGDSIVSRLPQAAQPSAGPSGAARWAKLDAVLFHFYLKTVALVTSQRFTHVDLAGATSSTALQAAVEPSTPGPHTSQQVSRSSSTTSSLSTSATPRKASKWFALEVEDSTVFRPQLELWKQVSTHIPVPLLRSSTPPSPPSARTSFALEVPDPTTCVPPMIIDIILDTTALDPAKHVLMLAGPDGRIHRADGQDIVEATNAAATATPGRQKQIILESWKLTFLPFSPPNAPDVPVFYKRCVAHFRALFTLLNVLPANRLRARLRDLKMQHDLELQRQHDDPDPADILSDAPPLDTFDSLLAVGCRMSTPPSPPEQARRSQTEIGLHTPLGAQPGASESAPASPGAGREGGAERKPVASIRVFEPLICQMGALQLQVTLRNDVDFSVDDVESLRSLVDMNVDEDYFRPTVAAHRIRVSSASSAAPINERQALPTSPAKERPLPSVLQRGPDSSNVQQPGGDIPASSSFKSSPASAQRMPSLPPLPSFSTRQTPPSTTAMPSPGLFEASLGTQQHLSGATAIGGPGPSPSILSRSPSVFNPVTQSSKPVAGLSSLRRASSLNPGAANSPNLGPGASGYSIGTPGVGTAGGGIPAGLGALRSSSAIGSGALHGGGSGASSAYPSSFNSTGTSTPASTAWGHVPGHGQLLAAEVGNVVGPPRPSFSTPVGGAGEPAFRIQHSRRPSISDRDRRLRSTGSFSSDMAQYAVAAGSPPAFGVGTPGSGGQHGYPYPYSSSLGSTSAAGLASNVLGSSVGSNSGLQRQPLVRASISHATPLPVRSGTSFSPSSPSPLSNPNVPHGLHIPEQHYALMGPSSLGSTSGAAFAPRSPSTLSGRRSQFILQQQQQQLALANSLSTCASLSQMSTFMRSNIGASTTLRAVFDTYAPDTGQVDPKKDSPATRLQGLPTSPLPRRHSQLGAGTSGVVLDRIGTVGGGSPRAAGSTNITSTTNTMGALERLSIATAASKRSEEAMEKNPGTNTGVGGSPGPGPGVSGQIASPSPPLSSLPEVGTVPGLGVGEEGLLAASPSGLFGNRPRRRSSALSAFGGIRPSFLAGSPADDDLGAFVRMLDARPSLSTTKGGESTDSPTRSSELRKEIGKETDWSESAVGRLSFSGGRNARTGSGSGSGSTSAAGLQVTDSGAALSSSRHPAAPKNRSQIDELMQRMALAVKGDSTPSSNEHFPFARSEASPFTHRSSFGGGLMSRQQQPVDPLSQHAGAAVGGTAGLSAPSAATGAAMKTNRSGSGSGSGNSSGFSIRGGHTRGATSVSSGGHGVQPGLYRGPTGVGFQGTSLESLPPQPNYDPGEDETAGRLELVEGEGIHGPTISSRQPPLPSPGIATASSAAAAAAAAPSALPRDTTSRYKLRGASASPSGNGAGSIGTAAGPSVGSYGSNGESSRRDEASSLEPATYAGLTRLGMGRGAYYRGGMRNIDTMGGAAQIGSSFDHPNGSGSSPAGAGAGSHGAGAMTIPRSRGESLARHYTSRSPAEESGGSIARAHGAYYARNGALGGGFAGTSAPPSAADAGGASTGYAGFGSGLPPPGPVYGFAPATPSATSLAARRRGVGSAPGQQAPGDAGAGGSGAAGGGAAEAGPSGAM